MAGDERQVSRRLLSAQLFCLLREREVLPRKAGDERRILRRPLSAQLFCLLREREVLPLHIVSNKTACILRRKRNVQAVIIHCFH